ncbi:MmcQ/YjbR family DNA-binding protein [uncultured Tateyamaria sp.]|uniref:MmcQ/YjbR family DNA-binding protein n=1 Tax=Tateyamaria sp. 1078 TaxID=3417464 RepID=UPI002618A94C|nr:MmcQ/YjbR family DNA-binding protein [uncultured Tateyamaria sp.]
MTRDDVDTICAALPGAWFASHHDGGLDAWKVGDKMFATIGMVGDGVSVKCVDTEIAQMLIDAGAAIKAKYFHRSWVRVPFDGADPEAMRARIHSSYALIRASLPKKHRAALPAWDAEG